MSERVPPHSLRAAANFARGVQGAAEAGADEAAVLASLADIENETAALRLSAEGLAADEAVAVELLALIERTLGSLSTLERLRTRDRDHDEMENWLAECTPVYAPPSVSDICFVGAFELRRVHRELDEAASPDERLIAAETAQRKLLRAVRAALAAARPPNGGETVHADTSPYRPEDIDAALAVRRLYAAFRRSLRRPADEHPDAVLAALRYAASALATLITAPAYAAVRASDRALLRRLHERMILWARHDRPVAVGLQLIDDVSTTADLLRGINRRQELRAHDGALIHALLEHPGDAADWLRRFEPLLGLDDHLDSLVEAAKQAEASSAVVGISNRLRELGY